MAELKVLITDERGATTEAVSTATTSGTSTATKALKQASVPTPEAQENRSNSAAILIAASLGQQAFQYVTSNVGKWTGDTKQQTRVNNVQQAIGMGAMFVANWQLALVSTAASIATTAIDYNYERKWDARRSNQALARAGYSSTGDMLGRRR